MAQPRRAVARAAIPPAVLHGPRPARTRNHRPFGGAHVLHADVAGADSRGGIRRGERIRAGRRTDRKPLRSLPPKPRHCRLHRQLRRKRPGTYAGRRGGRRGAGHAFLGRDPGLRVDRKRLQQHLGGQGRAQHHPPVDRLHRRGDDRADPLDRGQRRGQLCRAAARIRRQLVFQPAVAPCLDDRHLGDVHLPLHRHTQRQSAFRQRPDGRHRRRDDFSALPVGLRLRAAVDDLVQRHLRQFRGPAAAADLDADLVGDTPFRRRAVVRLSEYRAFRRGARIAPDQLRPAA